MCVVRFVLVSVVVWFRLFVCLFVVGWLVQKVSVAVVVFVCVVRFVLVSVVVRFRLFVCLFVCSFDCLFALI